MGRPVVASLHHPLAIDKANNLREAKTLLRRISREIVVSRPHAVERREWRRHDADGLGELARTA